MKRRHIRDVVMSALAEVAPEVDPDTVDPDADLVQQIDLDSMDVLNLMVAIRDRTGVDIPERDYGRVATVTALVEYLVAAGARDEQDRPDA